MDLVTVLDDCIRKRIKNLIVFCRILVSRFYHIKFDSRSNGRQRYFAISGERNRIFLQEMNTKLCESTKIVVNSKNISICLCWFENKKRSP